MRKTSKRKKDNLERKKKRKRKNGEKEILRIIRYFKKDISSMKYEKKCFKGLEQKEEK